MTWTSGGASAGAATNSWLVRRINTRGGWGAYQTGVADQLTGQPQERLLEVVVGLGGDVVVLEVLLAVEGDSLGLHLTLLHIDLVTAENDGDILADTDEVACTFESASKEQE